MFYTSFQNTIFNINHFTNQDVGMLSHTLPEGFSDILMFRTLPYSSLEHSVAPLGLYRVLHSKECANVTLYIRRSYRSEITNIWMFFLSHGVIYLLKFYTQFAKYLFKSFIDRPKSWHFILQKCLLCLIWRVDLKQHLQTKKNGRYVFKGKYWVITVCFDSKMAPWRFISRTCVSPMWRVF